MNGRKKERVHGKEGRKEMRIIINCTLLLIIRFANLKETVTRVLLKLLKQERKIGEKKERKKGKREREKREKKNEKSNSLISDVRMLCEERIYVSTGGKNKNRWAKNKSAWE